MKKILLITNYFTPCTLTPSQRITFWAKNMHQLGYYPTVVTREWSAETRSHRDIKQELGDRIRHEVFDSYEVYYLPFRPGILDKAYLRFGESALRPFFLMVKLLDVFLVRFTLRYTSFANFLPFINKLVNEKSFDTSIISGEPFYLFRIGYFLKKEVGLKWIADYRDDWSTNELQVLRRGSGVRKWIAKVESGYEKKWVGTASAISSVSKVYTDRIAGFLGNKGITIENGFEEELLELKPQPLFAEFTIVYSGVLYPAQDIAVILGALQLAKNAGIPFRLLFLGAGYDVKEKIRIDEMVPSGLKQYVNVTDRLPRVDALVELQKSHAFLAMAYGNMKGIPSSKLYEYMALGKPVLLCPSDGDIMEQMVTDVGLGFIANSVEECFEQIKRLRDDYETGRIEALKELSKSKIGKYSRFSQLQKIKEVLGE
ncbi:glycosyltransferase involved in cell wall biosynthesis [Algoriphagus sp. 4150]|uniref:glycosyltransferase n=1 Tax=Algoriphagus sp. 4150 TaxID=2817756 RepID=UPI002864678F|nr:glycosyltransferase [Algoriphagus sp. 4150]MDR7130533.1 glycosyltransferase involved in cell wall biosynthesis [Algoriphagus sp. 4150]